MSRKGRAKGLVFLTADALAQARSHAERPAGGLARVPQKLRGILVNPARRTRIPRRRVPESALDKDEALTALIASHERALAQIESRATFFTPFEEDEALSAARGRVYAITRQARELRDLRRKELFDLQMAITI
jgi:hypothetical protein